MSDTDHWPDAPPDTFAPLDDDELIAADRRNTPMNFFYDGKQSSGRGTFSALVALFRRLLP